MPDDLSTRGLAAHDPPTGGGYSTAPGRAADTEPVPDRVGRYEVVGEIAHGGMGVVYRARDPELNREVAVKLMRAAFRKSPAAVRRFTDEATITGQLQHPGIPPVHEVGKLPDGSPFLAMKLIKGQTLEARLAGRPDRAALLPVFEQVCQAVGYAHAHGVIHRDLKPANVMVGAFGEVQVMDWGLAKVLAGGPRLRAGSDADPDATLGTEIQSLRGADAMTQAGSLLGTPAFMPPEQAMGAIDEIDARSDVFGLGAILCVILTGQPPYVGADAEETRKLAVRAKLDDAFARLDVCGADPDLVAVCERCLSPEKAGRPPEAGAVAAVVAVLRAAADERARQAELERARAEVQAVAERKRRRGQLVFVGLVVTSLVAGGAAAGWQWWRADAALGQVTRESQEKAKALTDAHAARDRTLVALRKLTDQLVGGDINRVVHLTDRDHELLQDVRRLWEEVAESQGDSPAGRALRAEGLARVGGIRARLNQRADAEWAYRDALAISDVLVAEDPAESSYRVTSAEAHFGLAQLLGATGRPGEAEQSYRKAADLFGTLAGERPNVPTIPYLHAIALRYLGDLLTINDRPGDAERAYREALAIGTALADARPASPDHRASLAATRRSLGTLLAVTGRPADAERELRAAVGLIAGVAAAHPGVNEYKEVLAGNHFDLGRLLRATEGRPWADAEREMRKGLEGFAQLAEAYPSVVSHAYNVANVRHVLSSLYHETNRYADAERESREAVAILARLVARHRDVAHYETLLAEARNNLGLTLLALGRPEDADREYRQALVVRRAQLARQPDSAFRQHDLAGILIDLAELAHVRKQDGEARRLLEEAVPLHRKALGTYPKHPDFRRFYGINRATLAAVLVALGDHAPVPGCVAEMVEYLVDPAADAYAAAGFLARCVPLAEKDPSLPDGMRSGLARAYADQAMANLRRAVEAGFRDAARVQKDGDLTPLRPRPDFQQLLAELWRQPRPREFAPLPRTAK